jgi:phosphatidylinositol glycan class B
VDDVARADQRVIPSRIAGWSRVPSETRVEAIDSRGMVRCVKAPYGQFSQFGRAVMRRDHAQLFTVCVIALAARLLLAMLVPNVIHPDETFQYIEQAYRAVTGRGLVPWEYVAGVRSWLLPGLLTPVISAAQLVSPSPSTTSFMISLFASILSLGVVLSAYVLGNRASGHLARLAAALAVALWPEIVLMSSHVLADTVSAVPLIAGLAIGYRPAEHEHRRPATMVVTGFLLCLALALRPQLLLAIACSGFWIARTDPRRYAQMALGALPVLFVFGIVDWLTWGAPFSSIVRYIGVNKSGVAAHFGIMPLHFYLSSEIHVWRFGFLVVAVTSIAGARRLPLVAVSAFLILLTFSLIGHKEVRFIYPAIPLIFCLCGVGSAEITRSLAGPRSWLSSRAAMAGISAIWLAVGASVVASEAYQERLHSGHAAMLAIAKINADPEVCGAAVVPTEHWYETGAVRFRPDVALYALNGPPDGPQAFNAVLLLGDADPERFIRSGFTLVSCETGDGRACYLKRRSACQPKASTPLTATPDPRLAKVLRQVGVTVR